MPLPVRRANLQRQVSQFASSTNQKKVFIQGSSFKNAAGSNHIREVLIAAQRESLYVCERDEAWSDHDRKCDFDILTRHFLLVILVCIISNP